jgi:hypothetical protein
MSDPNLNDFYGRVGRIQKAHAQGFGFEAAGALGRSDFRKKPSKRRPMLRMFLFAVSFGLGLKGALYYQIGAERYDARVATLEQSGSAGSVQAFLMQADPITQFLSEQMQRIRIPRA